MTLRVPSTTSNPVDWQRKAASAINQMMNRAEAVATVTGATTLGTSHSVVLADASGGAVTITLPKAGPFTGRLFQIKKVDNSANAVTVDGDGSETIDGAATYILSSQYQSVAVLSDGTGWQVLPSYQPLDPQLTDLAGLAYSGNGSKLVRVKPDESGFELAALSSGWTQIATSTPTGTGTVTFSSIPATYGELLLIFTGVSHNSGTSQALALSLSPDGTTFTGTTNLIASVAGAAAAHGALFIPGYRFAAGFLECGLANPALANNSLGSTTVSHSVWRVDAGIGAIRLAWSAGNFDAGTITLYGR